MTHETMWQAGQAFPCKRAGADLKLRFDTTVSVSLPKTQLSAISKLVQPMRWVKSPLAANTVRATGRALPLTWKNSFKTETKTKQKNNQNPNNKPDLVCIISLGSNAKSSIKISLSGVLFIYRHFCGPLGNERIWTRRARSGAWRASRSPWALLINGQSAFWCFWCLCHFWLSW